MRKNKNTTNVHMDFLRVPSAQSLVVGTLQKPMISATRVRQSQSNHGFLDPHLVEDAFMVSFQHISLKGELWVDGKNVTPRQHIGGSIAIYDLRREWKANLLTPFDCVNFYLPRRLLDAVSSREGVSAVDDLYTRAGESLNDPTIRGLVQALEPTLDRPEKAVTLFVDQIGFALASHLVKTYSDATSADRTNKLSDYQIGQLKELIAGNLDGGISLPEISATTGLPVPVLVEGFKAAEGLSLHGWLQRRRVDMAKTMLRNPQSTLDDVALYAGFSGVNHLVRVFEILTGVTPHQYRNM